MLLERARERNVFHQCNRRVTADTLEEGAPHEYRLIARGDPCEARAQVHRASNHGEQRVLALDRHVEASPKEAGRSEAVLDKVIGVRWQARIGVQEQKNVSARVLRA